MSIEQTKKIQELEQRLTAMENMVRDLYTFVHTPEALSMTGEVVGTGRETLKLPKKRADA